MKFDLSQINFSKNDVKRSLSLPEKQNEDLAEFLGILTGDGYIGHYNKYDYTIEITGDSRLDHEYLGVYVKQLVERLFNVTPLILFKKGQNTMYLKIRSKGLFEYLCHIGFKKGRKDQIGIPNWIQKDDRFMHSFVKGLADTDFSLALLKTNQIKNKLYPRISINLKSKVLIKLVEKWLKKQGLRVTSHYGYVQRDKRGYKDTVQHALYLNGKNELEKWMILISFRNKRHLLKYEGYKKDGATGI